MINSVTAAPAVSIFKSINMYFHVLLSVNMLIIAQANELLFLVVNMLIIAQVSELLFLVAD